MGEYVFSNCSKLTSVIMEGAIPCDLKNKYDDCFPISNFEGLFAIYVPDGCSDAYKNAEGWSAYADNIIENHVSWYVDPDSKVLTFDGNGAMCDYHRVYDILNDFSTAPWYQYSSLIQEIVIHSGVKSIGNNAFYNYYNLTSINIPSSVTSIGDYAFQVCQNLADVRIPNSVVRIGYSAFWGCRSLTSVTMDSSEPCALCDYVFPYTNEDFKIYVPYGSGDTYRSAEGWSEYEEFIVEMSNNENKVYFNDIETNIGSQVIVPMLIRNKECIAAYQCDLYLPEGITIPQDEDGFYMVELCEDRTTAKKHNTLEVAQQTDGAYRIMCASTKNYTFEGTDGCVAYITLSVDANVADGDYEIWLKNMTLSTSESVTYEPDDVKAILTVKPYEMGDVTWDGKINVGDYTAMVQLIMNSEEDSFDRKLGDFNKNGSIEVGDLTALVNVIMSSTVSSASAMRKAAPLRAAAATAEENRLEIVPFTISAGEEKKISLNMINAMTVSAYQTDVVLPAGIEIVKEDGFYLVDLSAERTTARNHNTMEAEKQADGSVRIMCASTKNCEFSGNDGEVAVITVKAADNLSAGVYTLELKNTTFSTASSVTYEPVTGKQTVFAGDLTEMSAVPALYGNYTEEGIAAFNAAFDENSVATSFDLTSVTAMDASVALTTANPNAVIYVAEGMSVKNESNVVEGDVCANLVLTDGKPFGPAKTFTVKAGEYSRTLSADTYGTIVLPFTPDAETLKGYTFYELTDVETNALTFDEVSSPVAGKPYVVTSDGTATKMGAEAESTVVIEPAATEVDGWTMTGTYDSVVFTDTDELANLYCISGNQFKQATSKLTMNPFRAYFVGDGSVNSITLRGDDGTTNIISLNSQSSILNSPLYDLQGRRVEHAEQGIYIQNGKKLLVK